LPYRLACYLAGWYTAEQLQFGAMSGSMFETFVVTEIIKSIITRVTMISFSVTTGIRI
jgi:hypothetical protein